MQELYERLAAPRERADAVVDNRIVEAPMILRTDRVQADTSANRV